MTSGFPDPFRFDITLAERPHRPSVRARICVSVPISPAAVRIFFRGFLTRLPDVRLAAEPTRLTSHSSTGSPHLPISWYLGEHGVAEHRPTSPPTARTSGRSTPTHAIPAAGSTHRNVPALSEVAERPGRVPGPRQCGLLWSDREPQAQRSAAGCRTRAEPRPGQENNGGRGAEQLPGHQPRVSAARREPCEIRAVDVPACAALPLSALSFIPSGPKTPLPGRALNGMPDALLDGLGEHCVWRE